MDNTNAGVIASFDNDISAQLTEHGDEIREVADAIDEDSDALSEILDDIADEAKGDLGAKAANQAGDDEADEAIETVEEWIAGNVTNSTTGRRVAAAYAFLGREEARKRLGLDTKTWKISIDEIQHHRRIYTIEAETEAEALEKAAIGDTIAEEDGRFVGVVDRDNAEIVD